MRELEPGAKLPIFFLHQILHKQSSFRLLGILSSDLIFRADREVHCQTPTFKRTIRNCGKLLCRRHHLPCINLEPNRFAVPIPRIAFPFFNSWRSIDAHFITRDHSRSTLLQSRQSFAPTARTPHPALLHSSTSISAWSISRSIPARTSINTRAASGTPPTPFPRTRWLGEPAAACSTGMKIFCGKPWRKRRRKPVIAPTMNRRLATIGRLAWMNRESKPPEHGI